jgi:hypothetical protein
MKAREGVTDSGETEFTGKSERVEEKVVQRSNIVRVDGTWYRSVSRSTIQNHYKRFFDLLSFSALGRKL